MKAKMIKSALPLVLSAIALAGCGETAPKHVHNYVEHPQVASTCKEFGHDFYYSCECGKIFNAEKQETTLEAVTYTTKAAHQYGTPTYTWAQDLSSCTGSKKCSVCEHKIEEIVTPSSDVSKQPTCTETGKGTYTAKFTKEGFTEQKQDFEIPAKGHNLNRTPSVAATCETDGIKEYFQCSVCEKYFSDSEGKSEIANLETWKLGEGKIAAFGHDIGLVEGKAASCTEPGWKNYYECSHCHKFYADSLGEVLIPDIEAWKIGSGKIDPIPHNLGKVNGQAATCLEAGWKDYYLCSACGATYEDALGKSPIADLAAWKARDGKIAKLNHIYEHKDGQAATCTANGWKEYYQCSSCKNYFSAQNESSLIEDLAIWKNGDGKIPATGHTPDEPIVTGTAFKYDAETTTTKCKVCKEVISTTSFAPWVHADLTSENVTIKPNNQNSTYDSATKTWVTENPSYLIIAPKAEGIFPGTESRKILSITFTFDTTGTTGWGGKNADFYFGVNFTDKPSSILSRQYITKALTKLQGWEQLDIIDSFVDASTGESMLGKSISGKKVTLTIDASSASQINNLFIGTSNPTVVVNIDDITLKSTLCGHKGYEEVEYSEAKGYQYKGTGMVCPDCGDELVTGRVVETPSPKLRLTPFIADDSVITKNNDGSYTSITGGNYNNKVDFYLPSALEGRTELAITIKYISTWDVYITIGQESGKQIVTADPRINWGKNKLLSEVLDGSGASLGLNTSAETPTINKAVGSDKFTLIYDLTKASNAIENQLIDICLYAAGTATVEVELWKPCSHQTTSDQVDGINKVIKCDDCGRVLRAYFNGFSKYESASLPNAFTYVNGVTFDEKVNCLKITNTKYTASPEAGYATNHQLQLTDLVKNARAAGTPIISFDVYTEATRDSDIRFGWGVQGGENGTTRNISLAIGDHWNNPTTIQGTTIVADNSKVTDLSGADAKLKANVWRTITLDVSAEDFATNAHLYIIAPYDFQKNDMVITSYICNLRFAAKV